MNVSNNAIHSHYHKCNQSLLRSSHHLWALHMFWKVIIFLQNVCHFTLMDGLILPDLICDTQKLKLEKLVLQFTSIIWDAKKKKRFFKVKLKFFPLKKIGFFGSLAWVCCFKASEIKAIIAMRMKPKAKAINMLTKS